MSSKMNQTGIENNNNWLVVGGAPEAELYFDAAQAWAIKRRAAQIATNVAWQLYATTIPTAPPDYYWISDGKACELFARAARWMHHHGTPIVTMKRALAGLQLRGLDSLKPICLPLPERDDTAPIYRRDQWAHPRLSGLICLQIAANHRAAHIGGTIVLVGMTGYKSSPKSIVADTFDGRMGKAAGQQHTREWIGPYTQSVIDAHRDITFIIAGSPKYPVRGHNVVIAPTPADLHEFLQRPPRSAA
jgi:hypothetical protein